MDRVGKYEPVIILGMHRSGTSLVTRLLSELGMHIGNEVQDDFEAIFFLNLNDWMLRHRGASWDHPEDLQELSDKEVCEFSAHIKEAIGSSTFRHYYNPSKANEPSVWGWKDPRNALNFQVWNKMYPRAKYIHVYRNPIDVAESLRRRVLNSKVSRQLWKRRVKKLRNFSSLIGKQRRIKHQGDQSLLLDHNRGVEIWKAYVSSALEIQTKVSPDRFFSIQYEEFLNDAGNTLAACSDFIGLEGKVSNSMIQSINPSRRYAFREKEELLAIYKRIKDEELMVQLGYGDL